MDFKEAKDFLKIRKNIEKKIVEITKVDTRIVESFLNEAKRLLKELESTQEGIVNKKIIYDLAKELNISRQNLRKAFKNGFKYFIKESLQKGYLNKKLPPGKQKETIEKIVQAFAFTFRTILKQLGKEKAKGKLFTTETIIKKEIRKNLLALKILKELKKEFPEIKDDIIKYAAFYNPSNPKAFINNFLKKFKELKAKHPDIDNLLIEYAVLYYPDKSEDFIKDFFIKAKEVIERILWS